MTALVAVLAVLPIALAAPPVTPAPAPPPSSTEAPPPPETHYVPVPIPVGGDDHHRESRFCRRHWWC